MLEIILYPCSDQKIDSHELEVALDRLCEQRRELISLISKHAGVESETITLLKTDQTLKISSSAKFVKKIDIDSITNSLRETFSYAYSRLLKGYGEISSIVEFYLDGSLLEKNSETMRLLSVPSIALIGSFAQKLKHVLAATAALSLMQACGASDQYAPISVVSSKLEVKKSDDVFAHYINFLTKEYAKRLGFEPDFAKIPVNWEENPRENVLGSCYPGYSRKSIDDNYITINPSYKEIMKEGELNEKLIQTLEHEYGHCYFLLDHEFSITADRDSIRIDDSQAAGSGRYGKITARFPTSVMYPYLIPKHIYDRNKEFYRDELVDSSLMPKNAVMVEDFSKDQAPPPSKFNIYNVYDSDGKLIKTTHDYLEYNRALSGAITLHGNLEFEEELEKICDH